MTREEALKIWLPVIQIGVKHLSECKVALDMAIKALEQEAILDKIRAEIKAMSGDIETIADVLAIIDKYRAESEGVNEQEM